MRRPQILKLLHVPIHEGLRSGVQMNEALFFFEERDLLYWCCLKNPRLRIEKSLGC